MQSTSLDHEIGWKHTFIKLEFRPSFGLTDNGPQEEKAVTAWETVMHDIYFLGGGNDSYDWSSNTYWGRINGTENEVMITTGLRGTKDGVHNHPPLLPIKSIETTPNILSPLAPFLLQKPIIVNTQWNVPPPSMERPQICYDLNLFHVPNKDKQLKNTAAVSLDNCIVGWYDPGGGPSTALKSTHRGNLYVPEGRSRSFITGDNTEWLRNSETFVHLSRWTSRELAESYKDPTRENEKPGWNAQSNDWYENVLGRSFTFVVEELGVRREEVQVSFKMWVEFLSEEERADFMACYPESYHGSVPTHGVHGKECDKCGPLLK